MSSAVRTRRPPKGRPVITFVPRDPKVAKPGAYQAPPEYTVREDADGLLSCDCPAWIFCRGSKDVKTCRHTEIVTIARDLAPQFAGTAGDRAVLAELEKAPPIRRFIFSDE